MLGEYEIVWCGEKWVVWEEELGLGCGRFCSFGFYYIVVVIYVLMLCWFINVECKKFICFEDIDYDYW